jgi:hypothetical protein
MKLARLALLILALGALVAAPPVSPAQSTKALLLFGGDEHKTFLGCLNCVDTSTSVL